MENLETRKSFDETYPEYPFSELVRMGIGIAKFIVRFHGKKDETMRSHEALTIVSPCGKAEESLEHSSDTVSAIKPSTLQSDLMTEIDDARIQSNIA